MGALAIDNRLYTIEEWQALELETGEKYEFHDGELFSVSAMSGGTAYHALIGANCIRFIGNAIDATEREREGDDCAVYSSDLQLMVRPNSKYVYADAAVVCGSPLFDNRVTTAVRNPIAVVEVLSPYSVKYDSGPKYNYYTALGTIRDYIIVAQDEAWVDVRSRHKVGERWDIKVYSDLDGSIYIPSLKLSVRLKDIYKKVNFD